MANENKDQAAVGQDALEKALTKLSNLAKSDKDEKAELLQKAMSSEISAEENSRLMALLGGGDAAPDSLAKSATSGMQPGNSPAVQSAVDVSEYLNAFHSGALGALETLSDSIEKSANVQQEFNIVLAKAVVQVGTLVKSLRDEVHAWGETSSEAPKAARTPAQAAKPLAKSMSGQEGGEDTIQKGEVLNLLEEMHIDSLSKGRQGMASCGEDLMKSIAKYEQTSKLSRPLVDELKSFRAARKA